MNRAQRRAAARGKAASVPAEHQIAFPEGFRVAIGMPTGTHVPYQTMLALAKTTSGLIARGIPYDMICISGSSLVNVARNAVLTRFLDHCKADVLFWIDSDMNWSFDDFHYLCALAPLYGVVSGAYPTKTIPPRVVLNTPGDKYEINEHGLILTTGCGLGFTAMTRPVLQKWAEGKPRRLENVPGGAEMLIQAFTIGEAGEDVQMFRELHALGIPAYVDPTVQLGHIGTYEYKVDLLADLGLTELYKQHQPKE